MNMRIVLLLVPLLAFASPALAGPVGIGIAAVGLVFGAFAASAVGMGVIWTLASFAITFVANAIFKQSPALQQQYSNGGSAPQQGTEQKFTVRQTAGPRQIIYGRTRVAGTYALVHSTDNNNALNLVIVYAGHAIEAFEEVWFDDEKLTWDVNGNVVGGRFGGPGEKVALLFGHGNDNSGALFWLKQNVEDWVWDDSGRLDGCAFIYVKLKWDANMFANGVPNITAVIRGKKVYDPRTGTTYWTGNSALCLANYLCDLTYGIPVDYATGIDETALIAAANACDESVSTWLGNEVRFSTDGAFLCDMQPQEIIGRLLGAMHGRLLYDGERWKIIAGVYQAPTLAAFTDDDLRAGPKIQTLTSRRDIFNAVKGTYFWAQNQWQKTDFPPATSSVYEAEDGRQIWKDVELLMTSSPARAQRLARIHLKGSRQQIRASMPCKLGAWRAQTGDTILWTSERYGWTNKPFEVAKATFAVDRSGETPTLGVDLDLRETAPEIYDDLHWENVAIDPAPDTNFPAAHTAKPATNLRVSEELYSTRDGGGVKTRVTLAWDRSGDAYVQLGGRYIPSYKPANGSVWTLLGSTYELTAEWPDATAGVYDFRVIAENYLGVQSSALIVRQQIVGLGAKPVTPTGFSVAAMGNVLARATWGKAGDLDVLEGGSAVIRHSPLMSGATWADGQTLGDPLPGSSSADFVPLKSGTYMLRFRDSTGQWSDMATFVQRQVSALSFTTVAGGELIEDPEYDGSHANTFASGGLLQLADSGDFDSVPDVDALVNFDFSSGVVAAGTYEWSETIDLGTVQAFRLTVTMASQVVDEFGDFDSVPDVDALLSFNGNVDGSEADAFTEVRTTDDDPGGSPVWSAWQRLDAAEFTCRAFQLRTHLATSNNRFNIQVSDLSVLADEVV